MFGVLFHMSSKAETFVCTQRARNALNTKIINLKATQEKNYNEIICYLGHDFTFPVLLPLALI